MRTIFAFAFALLSSASLADTVRHPVVPEQFWGLCRDGRSTLVLSAKEYMTSQASCTIQWVTQTSGAKGPIYSAHMRCSSPSAPQEITEVNQVIVSSDRAELSGGPDFRHLKSYRLCQPN